MENFCTTLLANQLKQLVGMYQHEKIMHIHGMNIYTSENICVYSVSYVVCLADVWIAGIVTVCSFESCCLFGRDKGRAGVGEGFIKVFMK